MQKRVVAPWLTMAASHIVVAVAISHLIPLAYLPLALGFALNSLALIFPKIRSLGQVFMWGSMLSLGALLLFVLSTDRWTLGLIALPFLFLFYLGFQMLRSVLRKDDTQGLGLLVLAMLMVWGVAFLSGASGGAGHMVHWLQSAFGMPRATADTITVAFRKTFHFSFYGSLALLTCAASRQRGGRLMESLAFGLLFALSCACFDEMRQSFSAGRTGSPWDVLLDMTGATTFLLLFSLVLSARLRSASFEEMPS